MCAGTVEEEDGLADVGVVAVVAVAFAVVAKISLKFNLL